MWRSAHLVIVSTAMATWLPDTANSQPVDGTFCAEAQDLLDFIMSQTDYPELAFCPSVLVATNDALLSSIHFSNVRHQNQPMAVYLPKKNSILLSEEIDPESPIGRSFIVHELVHALQIQAGVVGQKPCLGALEAEAYRTQSAYLDREGLTQLAGVYRSYELAMASCIHAYHPNF